jgi:hypothetical protein
MATILAAAVTVAERVSLGHPDGEPLGGWFVFPLLLSLAIVVGVVLLVRVRRSPGEARTERRGPASSRPTPAAPAWPAGAIPAGTARPPRP